MNYLKIVRAIAGIIAFIGFFLMVGAVGTCDYMDEIGEYYPITYALPQMIVGLLLIFPCGILESWLDKKYFMEGSEEE